MQLRSFTRWLCVGKETADSVSPQLSEPSYLPVSEDNNVLTTHFGRIFDPVLSVEIVHWFMHTQQRDSDFVTSPKSMRKGPPIGDERIHHVATVVLFVFYRITLWAAQQHSSRHGDIVLSFPAFIRIAVHVLGNDEQVWRSKLPPELHCVASFFKDMRNVFWTGSFKGTKAFHHFVQGKYWINKCVIYEERFLTGLLQIAYVLAELPKAHNHNKYSLQQAKWEYTPLRMLSPIEVERMREHTMPRRFLSPIQGERPRFLIVKELDCSGNHHGVLIERCNASFMRIMDTVRDDLSFFPNDEKHSMFRFEVQLCDVVHPILTHGEPWCLVTMPDALFNLKVLKIYMHAAAMAMPEPRPLDEQGTLHYMSALVRGDEELFHWLNAFRAATNEPKTERVQSPSEAVADPDASAADAEQAKFDSKKQFLGISAVQKRVEIITDKKFIPRLIETAASIDDDFKTSGKLLQLIHLMMSERIVLTTASFCRLHLLDTGFLENYEVSTAYKESNEDFKERFQTIIENIGEAGDGMIIDEWQEASDDASFICRPEAAQGVQQVHGADSDDDLQPPATESVEQQELIELDDEMVLRQFEVVQDMLATKKKADCLTALRMIMQLKPVLRHTEEKLKQCMPMLFGEARVKFHLFSIEHLRVEVPNPSDGLQPGMQEKASTFEAVGRAFGIPLRGKPEHALSAVWQQRLYIEDRSSAEILHPLNLQHNMYSTELLFLSVDLVKHLCEKEGESGEDWLKELKHKADIMHLRDPSTIEEAHRKRRRLAAMGEVSASQQQKMETQGSAKKQRNHRQQTASSAKAPVSSHAAAAAAAAPTAQSNAPYSPSNPEYDVPGEASPLRNPTSPCWDPDEYVAAAAAANAVAAAAREGFSPEEDRDFREQMGL